MRQKKGTCLQCGKQPQPGNEYCSEGCQKERARNFANRAVWVARKSGQLIRPVVCEICNQLRPLHAHHDDYSKPLSVRWLCAGCHRKHHGQINNSARDQRYVNLLPRAPQEPVDEFKAAIDRVLGKSYFAKPKQACALLNISLSTFNRAVRAGAIKTLPRGDYQGVSRAHLHSLMKHGVGSRTAA
jgi:hypothetical protein